MFFNILERSSSSSLAVAEEAPSSKSVGIAVISLCCILFIMMATADIASFFKNLKTSNKQEIFQMYDLNGRTDKEIKTNMNELHMNNYNLEEDGITEGQFNFGRI